MDPKPQKLAVSFGLPVEVLAYLAGAPGEGVARFELNSVRIGGR